MFKAYKERRAQKRAEEIEERFYKEKKSGLQRICEGLKGIGAGIVFLHTAPFVYKSERFEPETFDLDTAALTAAVGLVGYAGISIFLNKPVILFPLATNVLDLAYEKIYEKLYKRK